MTELVSAENILKHLSYSNLKVSHFAEHSKGVFSLAYSLPYQGDELENCTYPDVRYFIEFGSLGMTFKKHDSSKHIKGQRGSTTVPGWETSLDWNGVKDEPNGNGEGLHKRIATKIKELGYAWVNKKIGEL